MTRRLIAGLGNPGSDYRGTRHNIGFMVIERLAERYGIRLGQEKFDSQFANDRVARQPVLLLEPQTYVNKSGEAVGEAVQFYDLETDRTIVVHDDVDLAFGQLRVKRGGGHGGHNGVRDIADAIGRGFVRLRLGVGRPEYGSVRDHVLGTFSHDEEALLEELLDVACDALETLLEDGADEAQNQYNNTHVG